MNLSEKLKEISSTVLQKIEHIKTEEATKTAFVLPFISALGYDIFNPSEVIPEFTADIATKKGEKVDYAIQKDGKIIILIECKQCGSDLFVEHKGQLYRYFSVTEAKFAILTNGIKYHFFSDLDAPNKMDEKPFFEFDITNYDSSHIEELTKFTKGAFDLKQILNTAADLKYTGAIKRSFADELSNPSSEFIKFLMSKVYTGRQSQGVIEQFSKIVKRALKESITELVSGRLQAALQNESLQDERISMDSQDTPILEREIEIYNVIKAIARSIVSAKRINMHHGKAYCSILLDNSKRKQICKIHHSKKKVDIGFIKNNVERHFKLDTVDDIFDHEDLIKEIINQYLQEDSVSNDSEQLNHEDA